MPTITTFCRVICVKETWTWCLSYQRTLRTSRSLIERAYREWCNNRPTFSLSISRRTRRLRVEVSSCSPRRKVCKTSLNHRWSDSRRKPASRNRWISSPRWTWSALGWFRTCRLANSPKMHWVRQSSGKRWIQSRGKNVSIKSRLPMKKKGSRWERKARIATANAWEHKFSRSVRIKVLWM